MRHSAYGDPESRGSKFDLICLQKTIWAPAARVRLRVGCVCDAAQLLMNCDLSTTLRRGVAFRIHACFQFTLRDLRAILLGTFGCEA
jgi:hypothetical protein